MRGAKARGHGPPSVWPRCGPAASVKLQPGSQERRAERPAHPGPLCPPRPFTWAGRCSAAGRAISAARFTGGHSLPPPSSPGRTGESLQVTLPQPRAPCCSRAGSPVTSDGYRACGTPALWPVREPAVLTLALLEETALVTGGVRAPAMAGGRGVVPDPPLVLATARTAGCGQGGCYRQGSDPRLCP